MINSLFGVTTAKERYHAWDSRAAVTGVEQWVFLPITAPVGVAALSGISNRADVSIAQRIDDQGKGR
jgi:hypothetical protein